MEPTLTISLTLSETNALINVLGELPTNRGAWPLLIHIRQQAAAQLEQEGTTQVPEASVMGEVEHSAPVEDEDVDARAFVENTHSNDVVGRRETLAAKRGPKKT